MTKRNNGKLVDKNRVIREYLVQDVVRRLYDDGRVYDVHWAYVTFDKDQIVHGRKKLVTIKYLKCFENYVCMLDGPTRECFTAWARSLLHGSDGMVTEKKTRSIGNGHRSNHGPAPVQKRNETVD